MRASSAGNPRQTKQTPVKITRTSTAAVKPEMPRSSVRASDMVGPFGLRDPRIVHPYGRA